MANEKQDVIFRRGKSSSIPSIAKKPGTFSVGTDTGELWLDLDQTIDGTNSRIQIKDTTKLPLEGGFYSKDFNLNVNNFNIGSYDRYHTFLRCSSSSVSLGGAALTTNLKGTPLNLFYGDKKVCSTSHGSYGATALQLLPASDLSCDLGAPKNKWHSIYTGSAYVSEKIYMPNVYSPDTDPEFYISNTGIYSFCRYPNSYKIELDSPSSLPSQVQTPATHTFQIVLNDNVNNDKKTTEYDFERDSFCTNRSATIGTKDKKWGAVYSSVGTIQTSDRIEKSDIKYISKELLNSPKKAKSATAQRQITMDDIVNFVKNIDPVTFVYKNGDEDNTIEKSLAENKMELVQLGLIADDIESDILFDYVGTKHTIDKVIQKEEKDEDGNVVKEAVTEKQTVRGLQPLPLAVAALSCCKYLLQKIEELQNT